MGHCRCSGVLLWFVCVCLCASLILSLLCLPAYYTQLHQSFSMSWCQTIHWWIWIHSKTRLIMSNRGPLHYWGKVLCLFLTHLNLSAKVSLCYTFFFIYSVESSCLHFSFNLTLQPSVWCKWTEWMNRCLKHFI